MEFTELKRTIASQAPSPYPEFLADWCSMLAVTELSDDSVVDALVAACSPSAHCGGTALIVGGELPSSAGRYWSGYEDLANRAGCSVATLERRMAELKRAGLVAVRRRDHSPSVVSLTVPGVGDYDEWLQARADLAGSPERHRAVVRA